MDISTLVQKDLDRLELTVSEDQYLFANPDQWRNELISRLSELDAQFTARKAQSFAAATYKDRVDYENWRRGAVGFKRALTQKIAKVKLLITQRNRDENGAPNSYLADILEELKMIRSELKTMR